MGCCCPLFLGYVGVTAAGDPGPSEARGRSEARCQECASTLWAAYRQSSGSVALGHRFVADSSTDSWYLWVGLDRIGLVDTEASLEPGGVAAETDCV